MSASDPNSAIYVTDSAKDIKNKVNSVILFVLSIYYNKPFWVSTSTL